MNRQNSDQPLLGQYISQIQDNMVSPYKIDCSINSVDDILDNSKSGYFSEKVFFSGNNIAKTGRYDPYNKQISSASLSFKQVPQEAEELDVKQEMGPDYIHARVVNDPRAVKAALGTHFTVLLSNFHGIKFRGKNRYNAYEN